MRERLFVWVPEQVSEAVAKVVHNLEIDYQIVVHESRYLAELLSRLDEENVPFAIHGGPGEYVIEPT